MNVIVDTVAPGFSQPFFLNSSSKTAAGSKDRGRHTTLITSGHFG